MTVRIQRLRVARRIDDAMAQGETTIADAFWRNGVRFIITVELRPRGRPRSNAGK